MISGTVRPLDFMFDSSVWFSDMVDRMTYFRIHQIQDGGFPPSWKFQMTISLERVNSGRPVNFRT